MALQVTVSDIYQKRSDGSRVVALDTHKGSITKLMYVVAPGEWSSEMHRQVDGMLDRGVPVTLSAQVNKPVSYNDQVDLVLSNWSIEVGDVEKELWGVG